MAQTEILAPGTTEATSTDVVLAAGAIANISAFTVPPVIWRDSTMKVYIDTTGGDAWIGNLWGGQPSMRLTGPGTFRVVRGQGATAVGVSSET